MSIASEIERLQGIRNDMRTKLAAMGVLANEQASLLDVATALMGIVFQGSKAALLTGANKSASFPAGYYNGVTAEIQTEERTFTANGTYEPTNLHVITKVTVDVDNAPTLQEKSVTPLKAEQSVTPDDGYDGLSKVNVAAIPGNYADISGVTAGVSDVRAGKLVVLADGTQKAGTLADNGAVAATIDGLTVTSYTVPAGIHSGSGTVTLDGSIEAALAAI